jgi:thymidine kinase
MMQSMLVPELVVLTGPMFSGKSEELIRELRLAQIAELGVIVIKPMRDTRSKEVASRNGTNLPAILVSHSREILDKVNGEMYIGIDETQFFDEELPTVVMELVRKGKRVIAAGLDLDFREQSFETTQRLMALAQEVRKLRAVCSKCKRRHASRSQRLTDDTSRIVVGDKEYEPRCLYCFIPPSS